MGETHTWDTADSFAFADAAPSKDAAEAKPLKVLVIGNSFSVSLMAHFPACASPEEMFAKLEKNYAAFSARYGNLRVIRTGKAIQLYRYAVPNVAA